MLDKVALIIDKRKEMSTRYKKILESVGVKVFSAEDIKSSLDILSKYEPDLILLSDSIGGVQAEECKKIKIFGYNFRPVIVAISKSAHMADMIEVLNSGADDFLSEPIEAEEFLARINAHFRRHFENNINPSTQLFDSKVSFKYLRRLLLTPEVKFSALLFNINNFDFYKTVYGEIAADKMLQTYQAIITSAIDKQDYIGHLGSDDFILITQNPNAENIASYCIYAFDKIVEKFYSLNEKNSKFMLLKDENNAENPIPLVSTSVGIVSNEYKNFDSVKQLISSLLAVHKLATYESGSNYVFDRQKIASNEEISEVVQNHNLLIIEPDEALSYLIATTGGIYGYDTLCYDFSEDVFEVIKEFSPSVILVDVNEDDSVFNTGFCRKLKEDSVLSKIKIIATSTKHEKIKILNSGADVYLPKPYDVLTLFAFIKQMSDKFNG